MTVQEQIKMDMVNAMKSKDAMKTSLLRVVISEFNRIGKVVSDEIAIKEIRRLCENAKIMKNDYEIEVLETYLPTMLTEDEIKLVVSEIVNINGFSSMKDMGKVMGELKKHAKSSQIDNNIASKIVKELLV